MKLFAAICLAFIVFYFAGAFIKWDINWFRPWEWSELDRVAFMFLGGGLFILLSAFFVGAIESVRELLP